MSSKGYERHMALREREQARPLLLPLIRALAVVLLIAAFVVGFVIVTK